MHGAAIDDGASWRPFAADRPSVEIEGNGNRPVVGRHPQIVALAQQDVSIGGLAQTAGGLRQTLQHRPHVVGRRGDHSENVARRGLLSERLVARGEQGLARRLARGFGQGLRDGGP